MSNDVDEPFAQSKIELSFDSMRKAVRADIASEIKL